MNVTPILVGKTNEHVIELDRYLVHKDIIKDFTALKKAAENAGFVISIASGFRDFKRQLDIWNGKFTGSLPLLNSRSEPLDTDNLSENQKVVAILRWSALPGASRHHWGTDLDIFASNLVPSGAKLKLEPWEYFYGHQAPFYHWLKSHLQQYGFFFPYAEDRGGIAIEPWHISHQKCAEIYQKQFNAKMLQNCIEQTSIQGKEAILDMLTDIYPRFITNISEPF